MEQQQAIDLLSQFKAAYDAGDAEALADLFAEQVNFKGTGDKEYKEKLRQEVQAYFQKFVDARQTQRVELDETSLAISEDGKLSIDAAFHFVNLGQDEEQKKPISFKIELDDEGLINDFGSFPRPG